MAGRDSPTLIAERPARQAVQCTVPYLFTNFDDKTGEYKLLIAMVLAVD